MVVPIRGICVVYAQVEVFSVSIATAYIFPNFTEFLKNKNVKKCVIFRKGVEWSSSGIPPMGYGVPPSNPYGAPLMQMQQWQHRKYRRSFFLH